MGDGGGLVLSSRWVGMVVRFDIFIENNLHETLIDTWFYEIFEFYLIIAILQLEKHAESAMHSSFYGRHEVLC